MSRFPPILTALACCFGLWQGASVAEANVLLAGKWEGSDFAVTLLDRGGINGSWGDANFNLSFHNNDSEIIGQVAGQNIRLIFAREDLRIWGVTTCGAIDIIGATRSRYVSGRACHYAVNLRLETGNTALEQLLLRGGLAHLLESFPAPIRLRLFEHMAARFTQTYN